MEVRDLVARAAGGDRAAFRPRTTRSRSRRFPPNVDARLLARERDAALWTAFATLPSRCQALLRMIAADPPASYEDISRALGMPVGSIGPTRGRCLATLERAFAGARITA